MRLDLIQAKVSARKLRITAHALTEASKDGIRAKDIPDAILNGKEIERYPERQRVLIQAMMPELGIPIHVVCDYSDPDEIVVPTVYIPGRKRWTLDQFRKPFSKGKKK